VLVIESDEDARSALRRRYERDDAEVVEAETGIEGLRALYAYRPDLVLLAVDLPEFDGWRVLGRIRELTDVPVVMLATAGGDDEARANEAGADAYATKPLALDDLVARSEALLRHRAPADESAWEYADALVEVDFRAAEARAAGRPLQLSPLEFRLLWAFVRNPNEGLSPYQLLAMAWGSGDSPRERVKLYVGYLRSKFRAAGVDEAPIETVRGFGYRYRPAA